MARGGAATSSAVHLIAALGRGFVIIRLGRRTIRNATSHAVDIFAVGICRTRHARTNGRRWRARGGEGVAMRHSAGAIDIGLADGHALVAGSADEKGIVAIGS